MVAVHCRAGIGRSAVVAAAILLRPAYHILKYFQLLAEREASRFLTPMRRWLGFKPTLRWASDNRLE